MDSLFFHVRWRDEGAARGRGCGIVDPLVHMSFPAPQGRDLGCSCMGEGKNAQEHFCIPQNPIGIPFPLPS